jgi:hypothetical protein
MLSGETAKGNYPIEAVTMMAETAFLAESAICYPPLFDSLRNMTARPTETGETIALAGVAAAGEQDAGAIVVLSTRWVVVFIPCHLSLLADDVIPHFIVVTPLDSSPSTDLLALSSVVGTLVAMPVYFLRSLFRLYSHP